ncbi:hypothetical protein SAMN04487897_10277 [Paenibacillus sp. yr247]|uniref:hypothetical protein n=1 Tax=Paenibacillus sp. yr247 TaxID=1761880 RepID=UPI00087F571E|nr:hypothetical protein [Paenibacillus sp. yr247]SDN19045.1 hypothetical protein SAMN04487897_10277 [Paenibacillus sp. yr247]
MSVKPKQIPSISYELDIVKVASSLGIDQDRLLAYVYSNMEPNKRCDEKDISSDNRS